MDFVTIHRTLDVMQAELIFSRLDAAQFHPVIKNELSALSIGAYTLGVGGVFVQVPENEAEEAIKFIESATDVPTA